MASVEESAVRYLVAWVGGFQPARETADMAETACPRSRLYANRERCPANGALRGDPLRPFRFEQIHEAGKSDPGLTKARAELTAEFQILCQGIMK